FHVTGVQTCVLPICSQLVGVNEIHIFDERDEKSRPGDAEISNLAEDTDNAVKWFEARDSHSSHDLAIIAQLETSNASSQPIRQKIGRASWRKEGRSR